MHIQIGFILKESGFLDLQCKGFHWKLHYKEKVYPVVLHPYIPFIIGDTEGHDCLCGHTQHNSQPSSNFVASVSVQRTYPGTPRQSFATGSPPSPIDSSVAVTCKDLRRCRRIICTMGSTRFASAFTMTGQFLAHVLARCCIEYPLVDLSIALKHLHPKQEARNVWHSNGMTGYVRRSGHSCHGIAIATSLE